MQTSELPIYEAAAGLVSVWLLQRPVVAYAEVMMLSIWDSEGALNLFVESRLPSNDVNSSYDAILLERHTYKLAVSHESKTQPPEDPDQA